MGTVQMCIRDSPDVARLCDEGEIERVVCDEMDPAADAVERLLGAC